MISQSFFFNSRLLNLNPIISTKVSNDPMNQLMFCKERFGYSQSNQLTHFSSDVQSFVFLFVIGSLGLNNSLNLETPN